MPQAAPLPRPAAPCATFALKPRHRAVRTAMLSMALAVAAGASPHSHAAQQSIDAVATQAYKLPAGPLGRTLAAFAVHSGIALSFEPALTEGISSAGLAGNYTAREALARLLAGSGLEIVARGDGSHTLRKATVRPEPAATLAPVNVTASAITDAQRSAVANGLALTAREIPQSTTVVSRQRIEQQNLFSLDQAMAYAGGVTVERIDANRVNFYSRGFEITALQLDGAASAIDDRLFSSPDLAMYEQAEVLKGPAALLAGAAGPGGTVNLVRKRPQRAFALSGALGAGSWRHYRGELDVGGAVNEAGSVRARAVASYRDRDGFVDKAHQRNSMLYAVVEADIAPATLLSAGASHQDVLAKPTMWTLPGRSDFTLLDVPRSTYYGADWNREHYKTDQAFVELERKLAGGWVLKAALNHTRAAVDYKQGYLWGAVDAHRHTTSLWALRFGYRQRQTGLDASAHGPFELFGRRHQLLVGASASRERLYDPDFAARQSTDPSRDADWLADIDVRHPLSNVAEPAFVLTGASTTTTRQQGLYVSARFSVSEPLTLVLGGRVNRWDSSGREQDGSANVGQKIRAKVTPSLGAIYDLDAATSLYASYSGMFQPQRALIRNAADEFLAPLQARQLELGVKRELMNGALNASFALFRIDEKNRAVEDPFTNQRTYLAQGKARSEGFELGLAGQAARGWDLAADYSYTSVRKLDASLDAASAFSAIAPRHMLRLWSRYQLAGQWQRLHVGGGLRAVSGSYNDFPGRGRLQQGGYATLDASVGYQLTPRASLDLNVTNLLDRSYYQRINNPNSGNLYGEPRAAMLSLRMKL